MPGRRHLSSRVSGRPSIVVVVGSGSRPLPSSGLDCPWGSRPCSPRTTRCSSCPAVNTLRRATGRSGSIPARGTDADAVDSSDLVSVYDAGEFDGEVFMVLEPIEGLTLAQRLQRGPWARTRFGSSASTSEGPGLCPSEGHRPPRCKLSNVLFDGKGAPDGRLRDSSSRSSTALDRHGDSLRHGGLHGPRADRGPCGDWCRRHLCAGARLLECLSGDEAFQALVPAALPGSRTIPWSRRPRPPWPDLLGAMTARSRPTSRRCQCRWVLGDEQAEHGEAATLPMCRPLASPASLRWRLRQLRWPLIADGGFDRGRWSPCLY